MVASRVVHMMQMQEKSWSDCQTIRTSRAAMLALIVPALLATAQTAATAQEGHNPQPAPTDDAVIHDRVDAWTGGFAGAPIRFAQR